MRWTVVVPGALVPEPLAAAVLQAADVPQLAQLLSRTEVESTIEFEEPGATHLDWLWRQFGGSGAPVTAPYALHALDASIDQGSQCWHLDPVHFAFARDHLLVTGLGDSPLTAEEDDALARAAQGALDEFAAASAPKLHRIGGHWLLSLRAPWKLAAGALDAALGRPVLECWPQGDDARAWRKLLTEIQVRWHHEPLNEARETRGARTANALWLHGGGAWRPLSQRPFDAVASDDPVLRGWALAAGVPATSLYAAGTVARATGVSLWRGLLASAQFKDWGSWLRELAALQAELQALLAGGCDELAIVLCGSRQLRVVRLSRKRWTFRRRSPWPPLLTEAQ